MSFVGIDIGTTGCKAVAFSLDGTTLAGAYREYPLLFPRPGWAELDSGQVISKCHEVIREVAQKVKNRDAVQAIAASSQGEAMTPVNKAGEIIDHAMVSFDTRNVAECERLKTEFGLEKAYNITGHTLHTMSSFAKLEWLKAHKKSVWTKTWKFLCFEDLFVHSMGLRPVIDYSVAGRTLLFDIHKQRWSDEILRRIGLEPGQLADPMRSGSAVGEISPKMARKLGLGPNVVCVTGGHDQCCGALGSGATRPGSAMYAIGTVECVALVMKEKTLNADFMAGNLCTYHHVVHGNYITLAYSLTGGNLLRWFRDTLGYQELQEAKKAKRDVYDCIVGKAASTPSSLLMLPYFMSTGTPYFDPKAKGALLGLSLSTTRADIIRAILEAVAYEIRLNVSVLKNAGMPIRKFHAIGGGSKNRAWMQIKADILGVPITTMKVTESACLGAGLLAAKGAGLAKTIDEIVPVFAKEAHTLYPDRKTGRLYDERFEIYRQLYPSLKPVNDRLHAMNT